MENFSWAMPYASRRMPIFAENIVATSQPLAAQAGLRMLQDGGNAVDAAWHCYHLDGGRTGDEWHWL